MYCSTETRKVIDLIEEYGPVVHHSDYIRVEQAVGRFWNTHIQKIVVDIMKSGDPNTKLTRIKELGTWRYFEKPVLSMLTPRGGARRIEELDFEITPWVEQVYSLVSSSLLLADFNMKELSHLVVDIPTMVTNIESLARAIAACKTQNSRTIYYLHGVVRRDYQTSQGRIKEIQRKADTHESSGWTAPEDYESLDAIERRQIASDWQDTLNTIAITRALDEAN